MQVVVTISRASRTRLPYTQIYPIYDLYINIYTHTYISIACTCRPRSLGLAQLWGARKSPGHASGRLYREQGESSQQHKRMPPGGRVGVTQLATTAQCPAFLPHPPKQENTWLAGGSGTHLSSQSLGDRGRTIFVSLRSGGPHLVSMVVSFRLAGAT